MDEDEQREVADEFGDLVNMTSRQLSEWLETDESQEVGADAGDGESKGHKSGRRIVDIIERHKDDYSDDDYEHMRYVNGYVKRHLAQGGPDDDVEDSRWRYSLMNWGHDPLKS